MENGIHNNEEEIIPQIFPDEINGPAQNVSSIPVIPQLSVALGLLALVFGVTYIGASHSLKQQTITEEISRKNISTAAVQRQDISLEEAFASLSLEAKSAFVWDVREERVLFSKQAETVRPLASITKLMTALIAYELLDHEEILKISARGIQADGDSGFTEGETFAMQNLMDLTLIESSNDGATTLGIEAGKILFGDADPEETFVEAMNVRAEELGLSNMRFRNSTGLDLSSTTAGAYGSARDVAMLMDYIITNVPDMVAMTKLPKLKVSNEDGAYHLAHNTNTDVADMEGLIASKTGYTQLSGGNLVVAFHAGLDRPIIAVVLGSSESGRFTDTIQLIERVRKYLSAKE